MSQVFGRQGESDLFEQFAKKRRNRVFIGLDLSARLHEPDATCLADQKYPSSVIVDQGRGNADYADWACHDKSAEIAILSP